MSELEKLKARLKSLPRDFTYDELKSLLNKLEFQEMNKGKTSGSRVKFYRERDNESVRCHKPHPANVMDRGFLKDLLNQLVALGEIKE